MRSAEVPVTAETRRPQRTSPYSMLGLTWRGADPSSLRFRSRGASGWSSWRTAEILRDGPTAGTESRGRRGTEPMWVGPSDGVQVDVRGSGHRDLRLVLIDPGVLPSDASARAGSVTASGRGSTRAAAKPTAAPRPPLLFRKAWGADPSWRNGSPTYNRGLRQVHVHHTASSNSYTRAQVPAILRGMYRYHTASLGWFDLGYNFVVDRFGRAWVGRSGGPDRPVRGAHTLGFNHNSVGIAVLGNFEATRPTTKAVTAVVRLAAWKLDRHRRDAGGTVAVTSEGSDRYASGAQVRLPVIDGHRDTNETACPGAHLYDRLPGIRHRAQKRVDRFDPR
ncbi:peptidoglycan recognition protein [Nocardioides sp. cx-169]|uniref:peptidoglycan recognition protein family protein n=1 Tax=Nocardioides sp. cx-169 TaxID=2899080 RepID=UPI001E4F298E|nr:peptidoglycan recognition protein [Nocardioides sp. cx-169]MCD4535858.1 peptidoglycan recognition protein [Nocardioides sp. cx-169]